MKNIFLKLLYDAYALTLLAFGIVLVADVVLPGFLTRFVALGTFVFALALLLGLISVFAPDSLRHDGVRHHMRRRTAVLVLISTLTLTAATMYSFTWWEIVAILLLVAALTAQLLRAAYTEPSAPQECKRT